MDGLNSTSDGKAFTNNVANALWSILLKPQAQ